MGEPMLTIATFRNILPVCSLGLLVSRHMTSRHAHAHYGGAASHRPESTDLADIILTAQETTTREVRERAAEILAAVGAVKLRRIALFRATRWAQISAEAYPDDREHADATWLRAAEWLRIGWTLASSVTP
jgi:hypothetical protein